MIRRPRRSPLFPYTPLFRSRRRDREHRSEHPRDGDRTMTVRTQVIPESGVKTAVPALEPLLLEIHEEGRAGRHVRRSEEHTSELQSQSNLVCRLLLEKKTTK